LFVNTIFEVALDQILDVAIRFSSVLEKAESRGRLAEVRATE